MGQKGRSIVKMDVDKLIDILNKALSDEWLAYYQYWVGAKVVKGPMKDAVISELTLPIALPSALNSVMVTVTRSIRSAPIFFIVPTITRAPAGSVST